MPNAVASLLRLASADLRDAGLLSSGRNPVNAPALVKLAFDHLVLAVIATERGWPRQAPEAALRLLPDATPLKAGLNKVAALLRAVQIFPGVMQDGAAAPAPDREGIRSAIAAMSALLKDLASQFEVDLLGEGPARRASPVRPEPAPPPTPPSTPPPAKPQLAPPKAQPSVKPAAVIVPPAKPDALPADAHAVAGRSPIEVSTSPNSTASAAFWAMMDRWHVGDLDALDLIGHAGGLTKKGTRPRFKLVGEEVAMFQGLREIESALGSLQLKPQAWLHQAVKAAPFGGATPIAYLTRQGRSGLRDAVRFILQQGLALSMAASVNAHGSAS